MKEGSEKIHPYNGDSRNKGEQVRDMFDNIAPAYDFMNRAMTFGIDKLWRKKAINKIKRHLLQPGVKENSLILDVASGTGDLAILLAEEFHHSRVEGVDLSSGMIEVGNKKIEKANLSDRIKLQVADCLSLPFNNETFDVVTVAYGVRNFEKLIEGYREMYRTMRTGGMLCVLELSTPKAKLVYPLYKLYTNYIIPFVGKLISKDIRAYSYLPESIAAVAQGDDMIRLIEICGFRDAKYFPLTFGVCTIYVAYK